MSALLPIETNDERPIPRAARSWSAAIPSAPLCDGEGDAARAPAGRAERRVEATSGGVHDADAVRPDQPHPSRAADGEQRPPRSAFRSGLANRPSARPAPEPPSAAHSRRREDRARRQGDDGQVDGAGDGRDRAGGGHARPPPAGSHGMQRAGEAAGQRLGKTAAPTVRAGARPRDRDGGWAEDVGQRGDAVIRSRGSKRRRASGVARSGTRARWSSGRVLAETGKPESRKTPSIR